MKVLLLNKLLENGIIKNNCFTLKQLKNESDNEEKIFHEEFFIRRPLLNAFLNEKDSVFTY